MTQVLLNQVSTTSSITLLILNLRAPFRTNSTCKIVADNGSTLIPLCSKMSELTTIDV